MRSFIEKDTNAYWRAIVTLFLGSVAAFGAEYCLQAIIPVLAKEFNLMPATASLAMSFGTAGMAFAMIGIASFATRLERKKTMTIALGVAAILAIAIAISSSFELILGLRLCQGILLAGFPALAVAYINEEFDPKIIGLVVGIYVGANSLGGLSGRLLISTLTDFFSWRIGLGAAGAFYLLIAVAFWFGLPNPTKKIVAKKNGDNVLEGFKSVLRNKAVVTIYVIAFIIMGSFVCIYNYISYVFIAPPYNLSQTVVGMIFTMYLLGAVSSTVMGGLSDRYGNGKILCLGCIMMLVGTLITMGSPLILKIIGLALFTFGFFGSHSTACSWAGKIAKGDKARISSMYMLFYYIGASVIGTLGGFFLRSYGWDGVALFIGAVLAIALLMAMRLTFSEFPLFHFNLHKVH